MRSKPSFFPLLFLLDFSAPVDFCKVIQAAVEKFLLMRCGDVMALQIREIVFGLSLSLSQGACTVLDRIFWVRAQKGPRHVALRVTRRCVWFHCLTTTIRRTSSRLFRCVMFACAPMRFTFSHLHLLERSLSHDRLGMPMEAPSGYQWMIPSRRLMSRTGSSRLLIFLIFPFPKVR